MTVWMVRAGEFGEQEQEALNGHVVTIHWNEFPDLSELRDKEEAKEIFRDANPNAKDGKVNAEVGEVWAFYEKIKIGDLAVLPLHDQEQPKVPPKKFRIGEVTGPYCYRTDMDDEEIKHTRAVEWIGTLRATDFPQDFSLGVPLTVYRIGHDDAEARIRAIVAGEDPAKGDDFDALGAEADTDEGEDARTRLTELAEAAGLDPNDADAYPDWATLAEALKGSNEAPPALGGIRKIQPSPVNGGPLDMVLEAVRKRIASFKAKGMALNEATTQAALINPVIAALGWDLEDPEQVVGQFSTGGANRVDNAFFVEEQENPILLVEAKALDQKLDGFAHQIMGYAGTSGAAWVVLTNGDEYRVYYAGGTNMNIEQRLFRKVRLTEPNCAVAEVAKTLALLSRERIGELQGLWDKERDDAQVRAAIEGLFSPEPHPVLLNFVKKEVTGLNTTQIKASLARICETIEIP